MGQGTWQMAEGRTRPTRSPRCAPASRAASRTSTPPRCTAAAPRRSWSREAIKGHPPPRAVHRQQGAAAERQPRRAPCARASRACGGWAPTTSTSTYCTGAAASRWPRRWARWRSWSTRARSARSASRTSTSTIWKRRARLLRSTPIACNQVLYHLGERHIDAELVAYCAPARHRRRRLQPVRPRPLSVAVAAPAAARWPPSPPATAPRPARWRSRSSPASRRCSRSRRPRRSRTPRRTRARSHLALTAADIAEIDAAFAVRAGSELPSDLTGRGSSRVTWSRSRRWAGGRGRRRSSRAAGSARRPCTAGRRRPDRRRRHAPAA